MLFKSHPPDVICIRISPFFCKQMRWGQCHLQNMCIKLYENAYKNIQNVKQMKKRNLICMQFKKSHRNFTKVSTPGYIKSLRALRKKRAKTGRKTTNENACITIFCGGKFSQVKTYNSLHFLLFSRKKYITSWYYDSLFVTKCNEKQPKNKWLRPHLICMQKFQGKAKNPSEKCRKWNPASPQPSHWFLRAKFSSPTLPPKTGPFSHFSPGAHTYQPYKCIFIYV